MLSIVISTCNRPLFLKRLLEFLNSGRCAYHIIVADESDSEYQAENNVVVQLFIGLRIDKKAYTPLLAAGNLVWGARGVSPCQGRGLMPSPRRRAPRASEAPFGVLVYFMFWHDFCCYKVKVKVVKIMSYEYIPRIGRDIY